MGDILPMAPLDVAGFPPNVASETETATLNNPRPPATFNVLPAANLAAWAAVLPSGAKKPSMLLLTETENGPAENRTPFPSV